MVGLKMEGIVKQWGRISHSIITGIWHWHGTLGHPVIGPTSEVVTVCTYITSICQCCICSVKEY